MEAVLLLHLCTEIDKFIRQFLFVESPFQGNENLIVKEILGDVLIRPCGHYLNSSPDASETRDNDDNRFGPALLDRPKQLQTIHFRHFQFCEDETKVLVLEDIKCFLSKSSKPAFYLILPEDKAQPHPYIGIVIVIVIVIVIDYQCSTVHDLNLM
jgi:hypothetical protein